MAFYSHMKEQYNQFQRANLNRETRLDIIKSNIQAKYQEQISANETFLDNLMFVRPYTRTGGIYYPNQAEIQTYNQISQDKQALEFISSISTQQYFDILAQKEEVELAEYIDKRQDVLNRNVKQLTDIQSNKGLLAKFYNFVGSGEEKMDDARFNIHFATIQYSTAEEALTEWQGMSQEEKTDYLADRFEFEGSLGLNEKMLTAYSRDKELELQSFMQNEMEQ